MKPTSKSGRFRFHPWTAVLLVLVIAAFAAMQSTHMHGLLQDANGSPSDAAHCSLCWATHQVAVTAHASAIQVITAVSRTPLVASPVHRSRLQIRITFVRPPPPIA